MGRGWGEKESPSVNPTGSKLIQLLLVISYLVMVIHGHLLLVQKLKLIINVVKSHDFYSGLNQKINIAIINMTKQRILI